MTLVKVSLLDQDQAALLPAHSDVQRRGTTIGEGVLA